MDYNSKNELTMDFTDDARGEDKITAVLTQLVEIGNLLSNHLGSNIDPSDKKITGKAKSPTKVDVGRMAQKPLTETQAKTAGAVYKNRQMPTKDYTGMSISKDDIDSAVDENMKEFLRRNPGQKKRDRNNTDDEEKVLISLARFGDSEEKLNPAMAALSVLGNDEKMAKANPLTTSEGKVLLTALNDAANKLRAFLSTTKIDARRAQMPQDMR